MTTYLLDNTAPGAGGRFAAAGRLDLATPPLASASGRLPDSG